MKILHINNFNYMRGGSEKVFFETQTLLADAGHTTIPFVAQADDNLASPYSSYFPPAINNDGLGIRDIPGYIHNRHAASALDKLLSEQGPIDIAHLHIYYGRLTASILPVLRKHRIPVVQTLHEYKLACPTYTLERNGTLCDDCIHGSTLNLLKHRCKNGSFAHSAVVLAEHWLSRLQGAIHLVDHFICISDFQLEVMKRAGIPAEKMTRLHNFVNVDEFHPVAAGQKEDYLLYFGRIEQLKGVPTLVEAAKRTGSKLKIAGTGSWEPQLKSAIQGHENIEALGFVGGSDLNRLVAKAKAVIVPSEWHEPFGLTVIEAKASGTPVIASNRGGIPELIDSGVDGLLFEAGNIDDLASAIQKLDNIDTVMMGNNARNDAVVKFSPARHLSSLVDIYSSVIS